MKAHGTCEQAVEQGVPAIAWHGNALADLAAKAEAASLAPPADLSHERARHTALHLEACKLIAVVQEAHMFAVRQTAVSNKPNCRPALARKAVKTRPPEMPRDAKRRRAGASIAKEAWKDGPGVAAGDSELSVFDFVQHQAAKLLTAQHLSQLLWSNPGDGRAGLHALRMDLSARLALA